MKTQTVALMVLVLVALLGVVGLVLTIRAESAVTGDYVYWTTWKQKEGGYARVGQAVPDRYNFQNEVAKAAAASDTTQAEAYASAAEGNYR
jgi:hypothetical protein